MEKQNFNLGHRERLRAEFIEAGEEALPDYKILEMLLFYGIPRKDTRQLAKALISRFGSLSGVLEADIDELKSENGMTINAACLIKLVLPMAKRYFSNKDDKGLVLRSFDDIGKFVVGKYFAEKGEKAILICMKRTGKVLGVKVLAEGDFDSAAISIRTIIGHIINTGATSVVLAHNHPSGIALPSPEDICITKQIADAIKAISVNFIDHIIVSNDDYVSMAQSKEFREIFSD